MAELQNIEGACKEHCFWGSICNIPRVAATKIVIRPDLVWYVNPNLSLAAS